MIVGYARVSSQDQNASLQIDALKAAHCQEIFTETKSGKNTDRPELVKCLKHLREGDSLVIWKLDRLGRSLKDLIEIIGRLENDGIQFRSLTEEINTKTANGKMLFHLMAVFAEFERNLIRERTMAGLASARARGRLGGVKKKTSPSQDKAIRELWSGGNHTSIEIAKQFNISVPTVFRRVQVKSVKA